MEVYERVIRALNFEEPDRVPIWEKINNIEIIKMFGGNEKPLIAAAKTYKALGIDATRRVAPLPYDDENKHWIDVTIDAWCKLLGLDKKGWITEFDNTRTTKYIKARPFKNIEELEKNLPNYPDENEVAEWFIEEFKKYRDALWPHTIYIGAFEGPLTEAYLFTDLQMFSILIYREPSIMKYLLDVFTKFILSMTKVYAELELGPAFIICDDIADSHGLMFPPKFLEKEFIPRLKTILQPLKRKKIKCLFHSDGNINKVIDILIDAGIEGLNPLEPGAGMDLIKIKEEYGDKLILIGNVDSSNLLPYASEEDIKKEVIKCISNAAPGGGYFISSSTEIHQGIPIKNALTYFSIAKKYGRYPI